MTNEEAKKIIKSRCYFASVLPDTKEALDMAIEALSAKPQGDLISRKEVAEILNHQRFGIAQISWDIISEKIKALPPVEQTEWISVKDRLPTKRGRYWITLEYTESGVRTTDNESFNEEKGKFSNQRYYELQGYKIIAWQEYVVPSPYKGE